MNILLISQCTKKAREQSCQILDQFAERKGDAAWQTPITLEGLNTLRRLLRKTARRNTAVACHWIKKGGQTELLWIVGNARRFNSMGTAPTNRTSRDILRSQSESHWCSTESIALLAAIAGLFHDFGKAGALFQAGLQGDTTLKFQPFRHEWVSVRLFQAFVGTQTDHEWLVRLGMLTAQDERDILQRVQQDSINHHSSPFTDLPPLARTIAWLILSHHRLPQYLGDNAPSLSEHWLTCQLNADWNALNHRDSRFRESDFRRLWTFPHGTPLQSQTWRDKAQQLAKRAAHAVSLTEFGTLDQHFTVHLARLALMLADHHYSAQPVPVSAWQDASYLAWANTDRQTSQRKQKLDEHNVGVGHHALLLGRTLPALRAHLPAITRHKGFRQRAGDDRFRWQNRAWDVAESLRDVSRKQGFFGINMASTGCGKTFANARIMYALAQEEEGCRFTVALGLRTLTLQTGEALRTRLGLGEDDLAVLIGSSAVRELYGVNATEPDQSSASADELFEQHQYVHYDGVVNQGPLRHLFDSDPKLSKLVNAPVLVATIDHIMPATEGVRGGKQIAPMLRLLTSDLVLDEPDDFDIADQHALCRLVNWTAMLGGRVLLSSATLPPSLVLALFSAYCSGRKAYQQACGEAGLPLNVCCAWFDEDDSHAAAFGESKAFYDEHCKFAQRRAKRLPAKAVLRQAEMVNVTSASPQPGAVIAALAGTLHGEILRLHKRHYQKHKNDKTVSQGLVRIANIKPLVAIAQALMRMPSPVGYCIHYCVYHSQHPLAIRSHIEKCLDGAFTRDVRNPLELHPAIARAVEQHPAQHHIFVVLGTSVIEVGRDWDADWGIIEPSSVRSLIQFAGRIQRHRQRVPQHHNLLILSQNVRAMKQESLAYCKPGFETSRFTLSSHDLTELLQPEDYRCINAVPRILDMRPTPGIRQYDSLIALEHGRTWEELLGKSKEQPVAAHWWRLPVNWSGELQRRTPFRQTQKESQYFLYMEDELDEPTFMIRDDGVAKWKEPGIFNYRELEMAEGVRAWIDTDYATVLTELAEARDLELAAVSERYGEINLRAGDDDYEAWLWHPVLGIFRDV
ncbi:type I-F CRISPR-associated helicase Cas3 [Buttiauxella warmboldiae]|uniref:Type I-F CRISPR-associated helicase Cas3 n=1 Tax=Buttiauxella warmboldiae TaxID=82993 RepID=A0A3N5DHZ3_9ENTR|nr:type I-F CRISPR-associated helicase Cas3f [Buttiauxella warmboldiae]RPH26901.1 type I-F CRISPR-associated helicase Cas3 [Buttiauxella warmboldiae]